MNALSGEEYFSFSCTRNNSSVFTNAVFSRKKARKALEIAEVSSYTSMTASGTVPESDSRHRHEESTSESPSDGRENSIFASISSASGQGGAIC